MKGFLLSAKYTTPILPGFTKKNGKQYDNTNDDNDEDKGADKDDDDGFQCLNPNPGTWGLLGPDACISIYLVW